eukprot:gene8667-17883_t
MNGALTHEDVAEDKSIGSAVARRVIDGAPRAKKAKEKILSTWQAPKADHRTFEVETASKYKKSDSSAYMEPWLKDNLARGLDNHRSRLGKDAIARFQKLAEKKYGSMRTMLRMFQMHPGDQISLDELSKNLSKRNLDYFLSREDQRMIFELYDKNQKGTIPIETFLDGSKFSDIETPHQEEGLAELKTKIALQLANRRYTTKLIDSARHQDQQLRRDLRNLDPDSTGYMSKDMFKAAFSPKYLDLTITEKEAEEVFRELCVVHDNKECISYDGFAKFLNAVNTDPNHIPFFDAKGAEVSGLKNRIQALESTAAEPSRLQRINILKEERQKQGKELDERANNLTKVIREAKNKNFNNTTGSLQKEFFNEISSDKSSVVSNMTSTINSNSNGLYLSKSVSSPLFRGPSRMTGGGGGGMSKSSGGSPNDRRLPPVSPSSIGSLPQVELEHAEENFCPKATFGPAPSSAARTRYKNATLMQAAPAVLPDPERPPFGKKYPVMESIDWSRVGVGGGGRGGAGDKLSGMELEGSDRYRTTTGSYFSDLHYESNGSVSRTSISDAESDHKKRQMRFENRLNRTKRNLEITKNRVELEELMKNVLQERRAQNVAKSNLRYVSTLYLDDLKGFSKLPLEHMQKKMNRPMHDFMWGDHQNNQNKPDSRDFHTVSQLSFASSKNQG